MCGGKTHVVRRKRESKEDKEFKDLREREKERKKKPMDSERVISCQSGTDVALTRKSHRWVVLTYVPLVALTEASQMCHYHKKELCFVV